MRYINVFSIVLIVLFLLSWITGPPEPLYDYFAVISEMMPGPPSFTALMSITLVFLVFLILLLPYWAVHARIDHATGEVHPDLVSKSRGGRKDDWCAKSPSMKPDIIYPTNQAILRLVLLLTMFAAFSGDVILVSMDGMKWWPQIPLDVIFPSNTAWMYVCCFLYGMLIALITLVFAMGSANMAVKYLPGARELITTSQNIFLKDHTFDKLSNEMNAEGEWLINLYSGEGVGLFLVLIISVLTIKDQPYSLYQVGGFMLSLMIFVPIWSAYSTYMDWRNDQWIASLVRERDTAKDPAVRLAAAVKLARLGPWEPK